MRPRRLVVVALGVSALAATATATSVRRLGLETLVARAERVILARCVAVEPVGAGGLPATAVTLDVTETLKGPDAPRVTFRQLGAPDGPGPGPRFIVGEEVLVFLPRPGALGLASPVGMTQGKLLVVRRPGRPAVALGELAARGEPARARSRDIGPPPDGPDGLALAPLLDAIRALAAGGQP